MATVPADEDRSGRQDFTYPTAHVTLPETAKVEVGVITKETATKPPKSKRKRRFTQMFWMSIIVIIFSIGAIAVGSVIMTEGSSFPYMINFPAIAGAMAILFCLMILCFVVVGRKSAELEELPNSLIYIYRCSAVLLSFTWIILITALGIGGIWGMIECKRAKERKTDLSANFCADGDADTLYLLSIIAIAVLSVVTVVLFFLSCCFCFSRVGQKSPSDEFKDERRTSLTELHNLYEPDSPPHSRSRDFSEHERHSRDRPRSRLDRDDDRRRDNRRGPREPPPDRIHVEYSNDNRDRGRRERPGEDRKP